MLSGERNTKGEANAPDAPETRDKMTALQAVVLLIISFVALGMIRQVFGADTGEPCDPTAEAPCKFEHTCVDEVCAPYCDSDEDCPHGIICQTIEDADVASEDAVSVCDMPTELQQKIRRQLDEAARKRDLGPRPLSEARAAP